MKLDERKSKILGAIVDEYVQTAEPVSSASLLEKNYLDCSSATIRNEMAELEKIGFLEKTHTSSGRIPSQKGYRYYVDELLREDTLSRAEITYIKNKLEQKVDDLEDLTKIATTTLSEVTHYTTVAIGPQVDKHTIVDMKFILLGARVLMVVILTDSGIIRESIIKFDENITNEQVNDLSGIFKQKVIGKSLDEIDSSMEEFIASGVKTGVKVVKKIVHEINKLLRETSSKVYLEGTNKVVDMPEFKNEEMTKEYLNLLNSKDVVSDVMSSDLENDINVYIGTESEREELKDFSLITFNNLIEGKDIGTIGLIGPTRMDYSKVITVMKYISKKLNDDFKKGKI